jgi:predicted RNA-binding protein (virulence factor B family)
MIEIGHFNSLPVIRSDERGAWLGDETDSVLLPAADIPFRVQPGQELRVFVYTTSQGLLASLLEPKACVGEFALMEVVALSEHGAFMDWGLPKDLLVPFGNQYEPMEQGRSYVVGVRLHQRTQRIVGATLLSGMFDDDVSQLEAGQAVELMVYGRNERGIQVIVDRRHAGMVYHDRSFRRLRIGDELEGWVDRVREDHRLDISLHRPGRAGIDDASSTILAALDQAGGTLPLHDKSPPEVIQRQLGMSKKAFKQAVGRLYKNQLIELVEGGIRRVNKP